MEFISKTQSGDFSPGEVQARSEWLATVNTLMLCDKHNAGACKLKREAGLKAALVLQMPHREIIPGLC